RFGALVTDFSLLAPGALHRANGGYLVVDGAKQLAGNYRWAAFNRNVNVPENRVDTLHHLLRTERPGRPLRAASPRNGTSMAIPLNVKIVLVGSPTLYYLLSANDEEFGELFKIAAEFDDRVERSPETTLLYARLVCAVGRREKLRPLDRDAVARVIEQAARMA